ncbi:MAG: hypothetical protein ACE5GW_12110, partial [Planctomycetota bacterium]
MQTDRMLSRGGIEIRGRGAPGHDEILSPDALEFVAALTRAFRGRIEGLLRRRIER